MAALSAARNTRRMISSHDQIRTYGMATGVTIYQGSLVMIDAGYLKPAAASTTGICAGRAMTTKTNSGADGAVKMDVEEGTFKWAALGADPPVAADVGKQAYMATDQEVAKTDGTNTREAAGIIVQVDSDGIWVQSGLGLSTHAAL